MQRPSLARWLVIGALAAFGVLLGTQAVHAQESTSIQGQNGSQAATGTSGDVAASNDLTFSGGSSATAADTGPAQSSLSGDTSGSVSQNSKASSADAVAGSQVTGCVSSCQVKGQNASDGDTAISGDAAAANTAVVTLGPGATSVGGPAQASQDGDDTVDLTQWAFAASGDAVAGSQVTGVVGPGASLSQQNSSEDAFVTSGDAFAFNLGIVTAGPAAVSFGAPAQAGQVGDDDAVLTQASAARSGDGVGGSQVAGFVGDDDADVSQQNAAEDATAASGFAFSNNLAVLALGPTSTASTTGGNAPAQSAQDGDNAAVADQEAGSHTGDAVAGSQVTGMVASEQGDIEVRNQQSSDTDFAASGDAVASNVALAAAGPAALADSVDADASAQADQNGDNVAVIEQEALSVTGDALAGAQVGGLVVVSEASVEQQNASEDNVAVTGDAVSSNIAAIVAGPDANAFASVFTFDQATCVVFCDAVATATAGNAVAQATQDGDNAAAISQASHSATGDALAGAQVVGGLVGGGSLTVSSQQSVEDSFATSGNATTTLDASVAVGPTAFAVSDTTAIAVADCLVLCIADADAVGGNANAQAELDGDIDVSVAQMGDTATGDALAGAQVTGAVVGHADVMVRQQNSVEDAFSVSGDADVFAVADVVAGPEATASVVTVADALAICIVNCQAASTATAAPATAQSSQDGDIAAVSDQHVDAATGDALSGAQVAGIVASGGSTVDIARQNAAEFDAFSGAFSGDAAATGSVAIDAGPVADANGDVDAISTAICDTDCFAVAEATAGAADAQAAHDGDSDSEAVQAVLATTGDALAGSQVAGVTAASDVVIAEQAASEDALAVSGDAFAGAATLLESGAFASADGSVSADATALAFEFELVDCAGAVCDVDADATAFAVASAAGGEATAQASQDGDNALVSDQAVDAATGDAVAGSQVTGVVASDASATVAGQLSSDDDVALSGPATATSSALGSAGPAAVSDASADALATATATAAATATGICVVAACDVTAEADASAFATAFVVAGDATAQTSQDGDNLLDGEQTVAAASGDAVAGGQVTGVVASGGADVQVASQLSSEDALATTGAADASSTAVLVGGPDAFADGSAFGDAVSTASAQAAGSAFCAVAVCSVDVDASSLASAFVVATGADADAQASQDGDNAVLLGQDVFATTGDAVAGGQVTGVVASGGADVDVAKQASAEDAIATSGDADASSDATVIAGPEAVADGSASAVSLAAADATAIGIAVCLVGNCTVVADATAFALDAAIAVAGAVEAQASHDGDNTVDAEQAAAAHTGDAVAGSQVTGVAASAADVQVAEQNASEDAFATSGDASGSNDLDAVLGASATADGSADAASATGAGATAVAVCATIGADCVAVFISTNVAAGADVVVGDEATAQAAHEGDNGLDFAQDVLSTSGDAVAGSQVTGLAVSSDAQVHGQNVDEDSVTTSGSVGGANGALGTLGPIAFSSDGVATTAQDGDSDLDGAQGTLSESGDATAGSQINGLVTV